MKQKPTMTFGQWKGISFIVITSNLKFNSMYRRRNMPNPTRILSGDHDNAHESGVLQESRIDDCWNVDANRHLSAAWTGFTQFTILDEKPPNEFLMVLGAAYQNSINHKASLFVA